MVGWIVWAARAAAAVVVGSVGLLMFLAAVSSDQRTAWTVGLPLAIVGAAVMAWPKRPNAWRSDPPTERQLAYAHDLGIDIPPGVSKGQLSDLISAASGR